MKRIELYIKDNGRIVCINKSNNRERYEDYKGNLILMYKILKDSKNILIKNNDIIYGNDNSRVVIKSYNNNVDKEIKVLIDKIKLLYLKRKKDKLRKNRIKRISAISGAIIISVGSYVNVLKNIDDETITNTNNVYSMKNEEDNNIQLVYFKEYDKTINNDYDNVDNYTINFEYRTNSEKYINTKNNYGNIINEISNEYGIDSRIMLGIATQESGVHNILRNGPAIGLMQIEKSVWNDKDISCYNYKTNSIEIVHITEEKLKDLNFNIKVACMIFRQCLNDSSYNIPVAIQMYNYGYGNIVKAIKSYYGNNVDCNNIIKNKNNEWLDARNEINEGDKLYLEHVLSYIEDINNLSFKKNNDIVSCSFSKEYSKKI